MTKGPQCAGKMVGVTGFEPAPPCSQSTCATELRYTPLGFAQARLGDGDDYTKTPSLRQHLIAKFYRKSQVISIVHIFRRFKHQEFCGHTPAQTRFFLQSYPATRTPGTVSSTSANTGRGNKTTSQRAARKFRRCWRAQIFLCAEKPHSGFSAQSSLPDVFRIVGRLLVDAVVQPVLEQ